MSLPKRLMSLLVLCVVAPVVLLAVIEGAANVGLLLNEWRVEPTAINYLDVQYDSAVGWTGIPNEKDLNRYGPGLTLTTDAFGFRVQDTVAATGSPSQATSPIRMMCTGGDLIFGAGVPDTATFCALLQKKLPGWHTQSFAQRGYALDQTYLRYVRDGARYVHDVNLVAFSDIDLNRLVVTEWSEYVKPRFRVSADTLVLLNVPVPRRSESQRQRELPQIMRKLRLRQLYNRFSGGKSNSGINSAEEGERVAEAIFVKLARERKAACGALVFVYLPTPRDQSPGPADARRERLKNASTKAGVPFIDLTPQLREVSLDSLDWMFYSTNALRSAGTAGNFTVRGHEWAASLLAERLRLLAPARDSQQPGRSGTGGTCELPSIAER